jgi:hypothetical protein
MAANMADGINAGGGPLGLSVVAFNGDAAATGTAYIIVQQSPWTGHTTVSVNPGGPGSIIVSPAGPGTGIG